MADPNAAAQLNALEKQAQAQTNGDKALLGASVTTMIAQIDKQIAALELEAQQAQQLSGMLGGTAVADSAEKFSNVNDLFDFGGSLSDLIAT